MTSRYCFEVIMTLLLRLVSAGKWQWGMNHPSIQARRYLKSSHVTIYPVSPKCPNLPHRHSLVVATPAFNPRNSARYFGLYIWYIHPIHRGHPKVKIIQTVSAFHLASNPRRSIENPIWWRWHGNTRSLSFFTMLWRLVYTYVTIRLFIVV